ncbi:hypothetical protein [Arthrobacter oryzae]|uniref:hypothetical protein n=1 Tax=Arthrobacter oryzae TaxID=409290 RepID=UPI00277E4F7F|nr:hypothetical protein [Arthrobacter oryzae]MDQ0075896.1 hypothetical protein [Arthrobacter oryzae]
MGKHSRMIFPVLALLLAGCAGPPSDAHHRSASHDETWNVGATHPRYDSLGACDDDPSVETAVVSADLPPSHLAMSLRPDATEEDAVRVAACLRLTLTSGEIWIASPS